MDRNSASGQTTQAAVGPLALEVWTVATLGTGGLWLPLGAGDILLLDLRGYLFPSLVLKLFKKTRSSRRQRGPGGSEKKATGSTAGLSPEEADHCC